MNSPDCYGDLELDPAALNELAVFEATQIASTSSTSSPTQTIPVDQRSASNKEAPLTDPDVDSDSNELFDPTFNPSTQDMEKLDAAIVEKYRKIGMASQYPSRLHDDKSPMFSSSSQGTEQKSPGHSIDHKVKKIDVLSKSGTKQKAKKRKASDLDEEGDEEGIRRSRRLVSKRQRTRLTRHSRKPPPDGVWQINDMDTHGGTDSDDDPIDFLRSRSW
ncbi:hypothetical protein EDB85DRAFT_1934336 [Lactarius pseudohatsudake]|nr:hypothetical protein EDB85DRAFT_1934336 [Lactarius pseudohatsudake]